VVEDPVILTLLDHQIARIEHIEKAWRKRLVLYRVGVLCPLWRLLALDPDLDRDAIYAVASESFDYRSVTGTAQGLKGSVGAVAGLFTASQWRRLQSIGLVPIGQVLTPQGNGRWIFASYDPTRPEVHRLARSLAGAGFELRYAPYRLIRILAALGLRAQS
jgi:hypothetical protein